MTCVLVYHIMIVVSHSPELKPKKMCLCSSSSKLAHSIQRQSIFLNFINWIFFILHWFIFMCVSIEFSCFCNIQFYILFEVLWRKCIFLFDWLKYHFTMHTKSYINISITYFHSYKKKKKTLKKNKNWWQQIFSELC